MKTGLRSEAKRGFKYHSLNYLTQSCHLCFNKSLKLQLKESQLPRNVLIISGVVQQTSASPGMLVVCDWW